MSLGLEGMDVTGRVLIGTVVIALISACASTPDAPVDGKTAEEAQKLIEEWKPQIPTEGNQPDWIKLKSGEWLNGELKYVRDGKLQFDSDELDDLNFDWDDIRELRCSRVKTVTLEDHKTVSGPLVVTKEAVAVTVAGEEEPKKIPRAEVLSILPGEATEGDYWSGKLSIGITVRSGNVDQTDMNSIIDIWRRSPLSRVGLNYVGNYGVLEGVESANNHRLAARYDYFLSRKFFLTPLSFTAYRDPFQNIDLQATPAVGVGYHIFNRGDLTWDVDGGLGYQFTRFVSVEEGEDTTNGTAALLLGTDFDMDLTEKLELKVDYSIQMGLPTLSDYTSHFLIALSFDVIADLDLDITFVWDRVNEPRTAASGDTPLPDDYRLSVGIGFEF